MYKIHQKAILRCPKNRKQNPPGKTEAHKNKLREEPKKQQHQRNTHGQRDAATKKAPTRTKSTKRAPGVQPPRDPRKTTTKNPTAANKGRDAPPTHDKCRN
jgi:hypothetical protein